MLLVIPALAASTLLARYLHIYAPSNVLIRRLRASRQCACTAPLLGVLAAALMVAMITVSTAVVAGAPGWLNVVVLILAWDAVRFGTLAVQVLLSSIRFQEAEIDPAGQSLRLSGSSGTGPDIGR